MFPHGSRGGNFRRGLAAARGPGPRAPGRGPGDVANGGTHSQKLMWPSHAHWWGLTGGRRSIELVGIQVDRKQNPTSNQTFAIVIFVIIAALHLDSGADASYGYGYECFRVSQCRPAARG